MAFCVVLVVVGYLMLDVLSGMVVAPKTRVREVGAAGELAIPLGGWKISSMQASSDGRYLAYVGRSAGGGEAVLNVVELSRGLPPLFTSPVRGEGMAWLGIGHALLYEDGGDIYRLDVEVGEQVNLTASAELDGEPVPSPDGRHILWTRAPAVPGTGQAEFWVMDSDGSDQTFLAPRAALAAWDPRGETVISRRQMDVVPGEERPSTILQTVAAGGTRWDFYVKCEGEALYLWWPRPDALFYISPQEVKGQDKVKGTWIDVHDPDSPRKAASSDGLGSDASRYHFYPGPEGAKLAYVGEKGLEYLDHDAKTIYRYPSLQPEGPLAWNGPAREIYYAGEDGIYRIPWGEE